jgi:GH15 family glucan-1,4-alpha-glucosidase
VPPARPIEDYALTGDTRTAALAASDGSIDWMCVPRFDGAPVFGRLVGGPEAGAFELGPAASAPVVDRRYLDSTATVETTWQTAAGRLVITEGMVADVAGRLLPSTVLVRRLTAPDGPVEARLRWDPRLGYERRPPRRTRRVGDSLIATWAGTAVALASSPPAPVEPGRAIRIDVTPDRPFTAAMSVAEREPLVLLDAGAAWRELERDQQGWREWCAEIDADLPHRDAVVRSLLTLRLLTYSPSGAPVAAPTTSLPEHRGGGRNWDYRYAWPRDASIGIGAFLGVGKQDEARRFLGWLLHASRLDRPRLPVLLTVHGRRPRPERELPDWPGYADSTPVRVGNGADEQHQLDGYGWVLDAAWLLTRAGHDLYSETWRAMRGLADEVARRWQEPDAGIWEERGPGTHHVHSKLMAWLALDRALRIAERRRTPARQTARWRTEREAIGRDVAEHGYNEHLGAYTRTYGSSDLDAAVLVLPLLGLEPAQSPRVRDTVHAIRAGLGASGPLVYRYPPGEDGLAGTEGAFLPCSFWLVQALAGIGEVDEAERLFLDLAGRASPLGLYAEEMDPASGAHLGNFPQALTHASLVQAALALRDARAGGRAVLGERRAAGGER